MGPMRRAFITAAMWMSFAACAQEAKAPAEIPVDRSAVSGRPQRIYIFYSVNPDCSSRGEVDVRIVSPPAHGEVHLEKGHDFPNYGRDNPRAECNRQEVPAQALFYKSSAGYSGPDAVVIEALYPDGNSYATRIRIDVWPESSLQGVRTQ